ncbi:MAG: uracil-xanthine permease, partial [Kiritimatiellae bacterium]|nr:uracil-xanthine permease [Kiritimatiellia bacterium]
MEKKTDAVYDARTLGLPKMGVLGVQHMFAMFGATILVPILTGLSPSATLLWAGCGTLLFHLVTKRMVPAFLGSSFAYLAGYFALARMAGGEGFEGCPKAVMLQYACLGVAASTLLYFVVAGFVKACGVKTVMRFFPPVVTGPIIVGIGLVLAPVAVNSCTVSWPVALVAIATVIAFSVFGRGMFKIIPILMGVAFSYVAAFVLGEVGLCDAIDYSNVAAAAWIGLPVRMSDTVFPLLAHPDWGRIASAVLIVFPLAFATIMEHVGDVSAISSTVKRNFFEDPGLHRTMLGDGLATCLASLFGAPANTTYGENTGVLSLSKVYDPRVIRIAACLAVLLSFCPK